MSQIFRSIRQLLIIAKKREEAGLEHFNDSKAFFEYSNDIYNIYKNTEEGNPNKNVKY